MVQQYLGGGGAVLVLNDLVVERGGHADSSTWGRRGSPISTSNYEPYSAIIFQEVFHQRPTWEVGVEVLPLLHVHPGGGVTVAVQQVVDVVLPAVPEESKVQYRIL